VAKANRSMRKPTFDAVQALDAVRLALVADGDNETADKIKAPLGRIVADHKLNPKQAAEFMFR